MKLLKPILIYLSFLILFLLIALEVLLRIFGIGATRTEEIGQGYTTYYGEKFHSWYWTSSPNITFRDENSDFSFEVKTNSLGHREREPEQVFVDSNAIRAIVLGDSFTEGAGAEQDSTFVRQLERMVNEDMPTNPHMAFYNAGSSGSDPFFGYALLRNRLLRYHPDIVIQAINGSDYIDYTLRGGFERFKPDSTCEFKKAPWIEPFYHYSYVIRMFLFIKSTFLGDVLMNKDDFRKLCYKVNNPQLIAVADSFNLLAVNKGFRMLFVIHPTYGDYLYDEMLTLEQKLADSLRAKSYCVVNIWQPMTSVMKNDRVYHYGYQHDLHFTAAGYRLMAQAIFEETKKNCPGIWGNQ